MNRAEISLVQFSSVQLLSCVRLFATPWTAAPQVSLSITNSRSLFKPMSTESVMPSNHLILCCPLLPPPIFPSIGSFQMSQLFTSGGQRIGVSIVRCLQNMNPPFSNKVFACPLCTHVYVCVCVCACTCVCVCVCVCVFLLDYQSDGARAKARGEAP